LKFYATINFQAVLEPVFTAKRDVFIVPFGKPAALNFIPIGKIGMKNSPDIRIKWDKNPFHVDYEDRFLFCLHKKRFIIAHFICQNILPYSFSGSLKANSAKYFEILRTL